MTRERQSQCSGRLNTDSLYFFFNSLRWGGGGATPNKCTYIFLLHACVTNSRPSIIQCKTSNYNILFSKLLKYGSGEIQL